METERGSRITILTECQQPIKYSFGRHTANLRTESKRRVSVDRFAVIRKQTERTVHVK